MRTVRLKRREKRVGCSYLCHPSSAICVSDVYVLFSSFSVLQEIKWMVLHMSQSALDQSAGLQKGCGFALLCFHAYPRLKLFKHGNQSLLELCLKNKVVIELFTCDRGMSHSWQRQLLVSLWTEDLLKPSLPLKPFLTGLAAGERLVRYSLQLGPTGSI